MVSLVPVELLILLLLILKPPIKPVLFVDELKPNMHAIEVLPIGRFVE